MFCIHSLLDVIYPVCIGCCVSGLYRMIYVQFMLDVNSQCVINVMYSVFILYSVFSVYLMLCFQSILDGSPILPFQFGTLMVRLPVLRVSNEANASSSANPR